jgi:hypothetical protein
MIIHTGLSPMRGRRPRPAKPFGQLLALGHRPVAPDLFTQLIVENFQVELFEQSLDGFGADAGFKFGPNSSTASRYFSSEELAPGQRGVLGDR